MIAIDTPQLRVEMFDDSKRAIAKAQELAKDGFRVLAQGKAEMITNVKNSQEIDLESETTFVVVAVLE